MGIKCPKCYFDNPDTQRFCGECGTQIIPKEEIPVTETLETPKKELTTGATFAGRYQIIEELGKGGMGKVYKVHDTEIREKVALKLLKPEISADEKTIERFRNEIKLARKIAHRNVCKMYDLGEEKGTRYITMEYVPGQDLRGLIKQTGQLAVGTTINIAKQVCEGLSEAHKLGVVHRDLKPQNIMIDKEGNARIMDFGIARSLKAKGITDAGVMIGTPEYMSPEQAEAKEVDHRSDLYSLGVILYEMVTGQLPFEGDTPLSIAMKHKSEAPPNPKWQNTQIPDSLSRVILTCMEKDRQKRYKSAEELLSELSKIEEAKPEAIKIPELKNSIAVLPFKNMSADPEQEYFCEGLAEELINALTQIQDLRVVARTSAFSFKGKDIDIREIGKKLNVDKVLEGSVRKEGKKIRITAQLINVTDGFHIWSEKYDRDMEDIFSIQDEISLTIVEKLKLKLLEKEKAKIVKRYTDNLGAYNLYLKGRYYWNKRYEGLSQRAIECFEKAIKKDPTYALAYTGIADVYDAIGYWNFLPPSHAFSKANEAAQKALKIDIDLAEAHTSLASVQMEYEFDWPAAEKSLQRAIDLNPNYAYAHSLYGNFLGAMDRFEEAFKETKRAQECDPLSLLINAFVGLVFYLARHYDEAIQECQKALEMDPNSIIALAITAFIYVQKSMYEEAIVALKKSLSLSEGSTFWLAALGWAYAKSGKRAEGNKMLEDLKKRSNKQYVAPLNFAYIYIGLDEVERALEWLEKAYEGHNSHLYFIKTDPIYDNLRQHERFKALIKKMDLDK